MSSSTNCVLGTTASSASFHTASEVTEAFELGAYETAHLTLWSPSVRARPLIERVEATQAPVPFFRYDIRGAGLIRLYLGGVRDNGHPSQPFRTLERGKG